MRRHMKILLISPRTPDTFWSFKHAIRFVSRKASMAPLGLLTVAAMLPPEWQLKLVDMNVEKLRDEDLRWADYVMLGAMIVHKDSVREIVARCAAFKKTVIAGGPLFTTGHEAFPEIQHFVLGEAEELMPQVVAGLQRGLLKSIYQSSHRPDITHTPAPRWDLIKFRHYVTMSVQFSRGEEAAHAAHDPAGHLAFALAALALYLTARLLMPRASGRTVVRKEVGGNSGGGSL